MMRRVVGMALIVVLGCAFSARAAETIESLTKKIGEQTAKYKSLQYNMHSVNEAQAMVGKSTMDGQFQAMRKGDKTLSRMDTKSRSSMKMGDQPEQTQEYTSTMINDGEFMYTITDTGGQKMAMKMKPDPKMAGSDPLDSESAFKAMGKDFNLKVLPDAAVEGKDAWVVEATPKDTKSPNMVLAKMVSYYDKKSGLPVKSLGYDKDGKVINTMVISDVKTNADIPAERFVFKAPPGVEVMDMTKMAGMGGKMPAAEGQGESAPAPAAE
jgi:outer membrane lipoprotein-sorting protein